MTKSSLRVLAVCSLGAVVLPLAGCGSTKITTGSSGMFAPQTGSILGRRVPSDETRQRAASSSKVEKRKKSKVQKQPKTPRADPDYMTRGGFR